MLRRNQVPVASMNPSVTDNSQITAPLTAHRSAAIKGRARVPGDKSISHRALLIGLLTVGKSSIEGILEGDDVLATARACRQFGAAIERKNPGIWRISGVGIGSLLEPTSIVDFGNSGTGVRLAMGMAAGHPIDVQLVYYSGEAALALARAHALLGDPRDLAAANPRHQILGPLTRLHRRQARTRLSGVASPPRRSG